MSETAENFSEDALLGGRVRFRQPQRGERASIDPVLLAAAVPAAPGDSILDVGCGSGAASLCLAARLPSVRVTGIDRERHLVRLAGDNILLNGMGARVTAMTGDLLRPPPRLEPGTFAHAMANPPFLEEGRATPSPDPGKTGARIEGAADLAAWIRFAVAMVRVRGTITLVHRADRIEQVLAELAGAVGEIVIFPLWPGAGKPARRIVVRAKKGVATPTRLMPGLVLHEASGRYTEAAEAVLREAAALALDDAPAAPHLSSS